VIRSNEVFLSFLTTVEQSLRRRQNIPVLLHTFASVFCDAGDILQERLKIFESWRTYMLYFGNCTLRILRDDDYEEFSGFFHDLHATTKGMAAGEGLPKSRRRLRLSGYFSKQYYGTSTTSPSLLASLLTGQGSTA